MDIMKVPYLDLSAQFSGNRDIIRVIREVINSGQFILGSVVEEFERDFARLCGVSNAVGVSSGTDALFLALKVLGIGKGDEVITVPNTFLATVGAITATGAFPRLVDVAEDYNIDVEKIEPAINEKTRAVVPVHLTGNPARMEEINRIASSHGLFVVADAAQAVDASIGEKKLGSLADLSAFSLHPLKNLNTCGDGGVITTASEQYYRKLLLCRNHGLTNRNEAAFFAYNCRLDSIKAAVARLQISGIGRVTEKRNKNATLYDRELTGVKGVIIPPRRKNIVHAFHTYVIQAEERDRLREFLAEKRVETKIHYPMPIHLMKAARGMGYSKGDFPVAESQSEKIVSLPIQHHLLKGQIEYVVECIRDFYGCR